MDVAAKIKDLAEKRLVEPGHFIVDVLYFSKQRPAKLSVLVDGDNGVNIDACANLSRELSKVLDEQNLIEEAYVLEVSTPGLEHPLKLKRQYAKNRGRKLKVQLKDKEVVEGKLEETNDVGIVLELQRENKKAEAKKREITFEEIEKAIVQVSFK